MKRTAMWVAVAVVLQAGVVLAKQGVNLPAAKDCVVATKTMEVDFNALRDYLASPDYDQGRARKLLAKSEDALETAEEACAPVKEMDGAFDGVRREVAQIRAGLEAD